MLELTRTPCTPRGAAPSPLRRLRIIIAGLAVCLFVGLMALPAFADDDEGAPPPPTPEARAAAGRWTIGILGLVVGAGVYYGVERHALTHSGQHPPEWAAKMSRRAIACGVVSAVVVWAVCGALSRPAAPAAATAPTAPMIPPMPVLPQKPR
jgi:hypothetical protein